LLYLLIPNVDGIELARLIKADPSIAATPIVMLTSMGQRDDAVEAHASCVSAYLTKPVKQSQLFDCLKTALNPIPDGLSLPTLTPVTKPEMKPMKNGLMLLAEDNIVNQKVATRQLRKLGYRCDAVANGSGAIEALGRIPYDLVLMDCQMPEMDGYEATRAIRRIQGSLKHTPIVAMTAHALEGDREKCLEAGMVDYITKPIKLEELVRVLDLFLNNEAKPPELKTPTEHNEHVH
jgi:CheY-like chemotaxis protein